LYIAIVVLVAFVVGQNEHSLINQLLQRIGVRNFDIAPNTQITKIEPSVTFFIPKSFYPVPTTDPVKTTNWKTYKSEKYSFAFRYPPGMYPNPIPYPTTMYDKYSDDITFQTKPISLSDREARIKQGVKSIAEDLFPGVKDGYLIISYCSKDYTNRLFSKHSLDKMTNYKDEGILIGGKTGRVISGHYESDGKIIHTRDIIIPLNDKDVNLSITYVEKAILLDEFDQIVSTFKFTN
jgi:hypothetical protein